MTNTTAPHTTAPASRRLPIHGRFRLPVAVLLALTAIIVGIGVQSFVRRVQTFQPLGVAAAVTPAGLVVRGVSATSELRVGDQIVLVNGELVAEPEELGRQLRRRAVSEVVALRGEAMASLRHRLPGLDLDFPYLVLSAIAVIYLFIGLYTLLRAPSRQIYLFHLWCAISTGVFLLSPSAPPIERFDRLVFGLDLACRLLLPPLTLHFFLIFPRRIGSQRAPWVQRAIPFVYLPAAALFAIQLDWMLSNGALLGIEPSERSSVFLDRLSLYLLVAFAFVSAALLLRHLARSPGWQEGRQVMWIALGMAAGYLPFLGLYLVPTSFGIGIPEFVRAFAVLPLALVPLAFAWAILRYRLWDVTVIVRDVVTYTLTALLGGLGFSLLNLLIRRGIPEDLELTRNLTTVAGGLLIAGMLMPAKQGIGTTLRRFHYRGTYRRRRALSQFGQELLHERDLEQLADGLLRELEECMDLEGSNLYLVESGRLRPLRDSSPGLAAAAELPLNGLDPEIWDQDFVVLDGPTLPETELRHDQLLYLDGYRSIFPLTVRERRIGLVMVGHKGGHVPLDSEDTMLIRQLLNQAALAIENAQLLEQMQRQLREVVELKQFSEELVESTPAGIAVLDSDRRIVLANLAFAALAGTERGALRRRLIDDVLAIELPPPSGGVVETAYVDHQGREHQLQLSTASFLGDHSHGLSVLVVHDVTELARMEKALEEKERMAAIGVMAAGVAHEVNTPLTGISSYAQMLLARTPEADPRHELLRKVERQTFRAAKIVNSLLDFARASRPDPEPVDLLLVLRECVDLFSERIAEAGIELRWPAEPTEPGGFTVEANEGEIHQVLANLLVNAIEASIGRTAPRLTFELTGDSEQVTLAVIDDGPGVADEHLGRVFQPFFSTKLESGGTGLGLAISYEMVRRHGGELRVENEPAGGCRFTVQLPRRASSHRRSRP